MGLAVYVSRAHISKYMQCYAWGIDEYIYPWFVVVVESGGHYSLAHTNVSAKQPDITALALD